MNWMDLTLGEFQAHLASEDATPGGGTAAAIPFNGVASPAQISTL